MRKIVLLYEDDIEFLRHLENIFDDLRDEFHLADSFSSTNDVLTHLSKYTPDIIILDIQLKGDEDGLYALYLIKQFSPLTKVMMLTTFDNDDKVLNAISLGADGYMLKTDFALNQLPRDALLKSLKIIVDGHAYLTPSIAKQIISLFASHSIIEIFQNAKEKFDRIINVNRKPYIKPLKLTKMQMVVLNKIVEGQSTLEISKELQLSENTINTHIKGIYSTLGVHSRTKAIKIAIEAKLIKYKV